MIKFFKNNGEVNVIILQKKEKRKNWWRNFVYKQSYLLRESKMDFWLNLLLSMCLFYFSLFILSPSPVKTGCVRACVCAVFCLSFFFRSLCTVMFPFFCWCLSTGCARFISPCLVHRSPTFRFCLCQTCLHTHPCCKMWENMQDNDVIDNQSLANLTSIRPTVGVTPVLNNYYYKWRKSRWFKNIFLWTI